MSAVAPRMVNGVSYVSRINHESPCSRQAQYSVTLGVSLFMAGATFGDVGVSLLVAGAAFGDVGVSLFAAGAAFGEISLDSRSAVFLRPKCFSKVRKVTSANGRPRDDHAVHVWIMLGSARQCR